MPAASPSANQTGISGRCTVMENRWQACLAMASRLRMGERSFACAVFRHAIGTLLETRYI
jgi:hypothetical protein